MSGSLRRRDWCSANMRPVDEREFSRVLAEAAATTHADRAGRRRAPSSSIGRPMTTAATVSTKGLRGITLYEPSEMVMSARAGTPLSQVEDELAARGQMLAFEPIELGPRSAAARRGRPPSPACSPPTCRARGASRVGAARDHLLGVRAVNGRGEMFKSGGRVMKNVTGLRPVPRPVRQLGHAGGHERGDLQGACRCRRTPAR